MSTISRTAAEPRDQPLWAVVQRRITRFGRTLLWCWYRRAAVKMLHELDDRALRDIGLQRCHIEAAVRGDFRRWAVDQLTANGSLASSGAVAGLSRPCQISGPGDRR